MSARYILKLYIPYLLIGNMKGMGYVLVKCKKDGVEKVYKEMEKLEEVRDIYAISGEYDIIAKIKVADISKIPNAVLKIRFIDGVVSTKTFTVVNLE